MARLKRVNTIERRASRRVLASKVIPQEITKLVSGQDVELINISKSGSILIYSDVVLLPGAYVRLRMKIPGSLLNLDGRIQRCKVTGLGQEKIKYEAAIIIDGGLPQALSQRLQFLDEEYPPSEMTSLPENNPVFMPLPDTAELWVLPAQEA
jgi:hypothetical protein